MEYIVETIQNGEKTQAKIEARNFIEAEDMVKNPALQNGEKVINVEYGDRNRSGVSVIETVIGDINIERRIYLSKHQS